jgi:hypothetical protein
MCFMHLGNDTMVPVSFTKVVNEKFYFTLKKKDWNGCYRILFKLDKVKTSLNVLTFLHDDLFERN